jgi:hypothetical protein
MPVPGPGCRPLCTDSEDAGQLSDTETSQCSALPYRSHSGLRRRGQSVQHIEHPKFRLELREQLHMRFCSAQDGTTQLFRERLLAGDPWRVVPSLI